jgi:nitroreductase/NAD-dependent dihydropyrimidine dehydrogenase PreA subunit
MNLFEVDPQLCTREGRCLEVCPAGIIRLGDDDPVPTPVKYARHYCLQCGHCVAVCPTQALLHQAMQPGECPAAKPEWQLSAEQAEYFFRSRRAIRIYKEQTVDSQLLRRLIEMARYAPSAHNRQPVCWKIISHKDQVQKLAAMVIDWMRFVIEDNPKMARVRHLIGVVRAWDKGKDAVCRQAPHLILTYTSEDEPTGAIACTLALSYLELAAPTLGLGTCWAGFLNLAARFWTPLQKELNLPAHTVMHGSVMVGYPMYSYHRLPLRKEPQISWQ